MSVLGKLADDILHKFLYGKEAPVPRSAEQANAQHLQQQFKLFGGSPVPSKSESIRLAGRQT